jgi:3-deoxy-D-manno-octulosonic acid kinase
MDLPVPRPVAAQVDQSGIFYRADIITLRIPQSRSLAQHLLERALPDEWWQRIGGTLSRFHACGVVHADLNAHNILLNPDGVFLIDFDRGRLRGPDRAAARANLARLQRSLEKLGRLNEPFHYNGPAWQALLRGYGPA